MIEISNLKELFEKAYDALIKSTTEYRKYALEAEARKSDLELSKLALYSDGKVVGKNQTERDACVADLLKEDIERFEGAKHQESQAYQEVEIARLEVDKLKAILRIFELEKSNE
jgi:hypothetical protein